jgi:hypothetical protein
MGSKVKAGGKGMSQHSTLELQAMAVRAGKVAHRARLELSKRGTSLDVVPVHA